MKNENDLRVQKTQKALCDALMELLEVKCFDSISISELCDRALVRRATFYKHFYDKYDFWRFFVKRMRKRFLDDNPDNNWGDELKQYCMYCFRRSIEFFLSHKMIVNSIVNSDDACILIDSFTEEISGNICNFLERTGKEYVTDPSVIATFCAGGIVSLLRRWFLSGNMISEKTAMDEFEKLMSVFQM